MHFFVCVYIDTMLLFFLVTTVAQKCIPPISVLKLHIETHRSLWPCLYTSESYQLIFHVSVLQLDPPDRVTEMITSYSKWRVEVRSVKVVTGTGCGVVGGLHTSLRCVESTVVNNKVTLLRISFFVISCGMFILPKARAEVSHSSLVSVYLEDRL